MSEHPDITCEDIAMNTQVLASIIEFKLHVTHEFDISCN